MLRRFSTVCGQSPQKGEAHRWRTGLTKRVLPSNRAAGDDRAAGEASDELKHRTPPKLGTDGWESLYPFWGRRKTCFWV